MKNILLMRSRIGIVYIRTKYSGIQIYITCWLSNNIECMAATMCSQNLLDQIE